MKGVIVQCLQELVQKNFGIDKWEKILIQSGFEDYKVFYIAEDVDDGKVVEMLKSTCAVLHITLEQAADAFGEYWVCTFAPRVYPTFFSGIKTAKDFLLKMDGIHDLVTKNMKGARPPRFEYNWENEKTLLMTYNSSRGLIDLLPGLVKGTGKYFKENVKVQKLNDKQLRITF